MKAFPAHVDTMAGYKRPESLEALRSRSIDQLERFNIVKAVTSGEPELVKNYKEAAPNRIVQGLWIPIGLTGDSLNRYLKSLPQWYRQGKFEVIGEVLTQYSGITPNDPILEPMWSFAEQEDIPVGIHIGPTFTKTSGYTPLKMKEVLKKHPNLRVYVMHAGYPKIEDMIQLMSEYPQVYVDLAGMLFGLPHEKSHQYLKRLVDAGFANRIMFGSDQQVWPQSIEESIRVIEKANFLTEEQKQDIFYDNAARFFGIGKDKTLGTID
ncbi:MAG: amidohydrolase family protein [Bacteroidales bacterium]|nr:amidohydrolase family protein [Bacteroidales bacterium]